MPRKPREPRTELNEVPMPQKPVSPIVRANVNRSVVTSSTFVSLYANDTQVQVTPWDVRLIFGEISDIGPRDAPSITVKQVGEVRMSPQHAKKLLQIISGQLAVYEQSIGPIPLPAD